MQRYKCKNCNHTFVNQSRSKQKWVIEAYKDYSFGKQTLIQLQKKYQKSIPTIRKYFDQHYPFTGEIKPITEAMNLIFDATFFGRGYGILVFRADGKNIYWKQVESEKIEHFHSSFQLFDDASYTFKSFTIDGRRGVIQFLKTRYPQIPIQLCQFHQVMTVTRYNTKKPKTACGQALRTLMFTLTQTDKIRFTADFLHFKETYKAFLSERNDQGEYKHQRLRSAVRSIQINLPYLFTWKDYPELNIPNTTNSCDGSFGHWKRKIKIHCGLKQHRKEKMIYFFLENS